jgi:tyrosyl-tRNA synthetase
VTTALGTLLVEVSVAAGLASSKGEARRLIQGGGLRLNDDAVTDPLRVLRQDDLHDGAAKLSAGRKRHVLVRAG